MAERSSVPMGSRLRLVALLLVALFVAAAHALAWRDGWAGSWMFPVPLLVAYLVLGALAAWRAHHDGDLGALLRPVWGDFSRGFAGALFLFAAAYGVSKILTAGTVREIWVARIYLQLGGPSELRGHLYGIGALIVVFACLEELVWRGLVTTLLAETIGSRRAWVWAAVLYAVAHVPTVWLLGAKGVGPNPMVVLGALGVGLVLGAMARHFDRLAPSMVAHALFDWTALMMFRLWGPSV